MSEHTAASGGDLRTRILSDPDLVLGDAALMRALVSRGEGRGGGKVVDLRSVAMARLEARLDRLEAAHRTVIAAAYDNLAGTQQVHRAILRLLEARDLAAFVSGLSGEVASILRLDAVRLVIEDDGASEPVRGAEVVPISGRPDPAPDLAPDASADGERASGFGAAAIPRPVPHGFIDARAAPGGGPAPSVTLRPGGDLLAEVGAVPAGCTIGSEACLTLDLGAEGPRAALLLGSRDEGQFAPGQGTELMEFLAGVLERALRRWLD